MLCFGIDINVVLCRKVRCLVKIKNEMILYLVLLEGDVCNAAFGAAGRYIVRDTVIDLVRIAGLAVLEGGKGASACAEYTVSDLFALSGCYQSSCCVGTIRAVGMELCEACGNACVVCKVDLVNAPSLNIRSRVALVSSCAVYKITQNKISGGSVTFDYRGVALIIKDVDIDNACLGSCYLENAVVGVYSGNSVAGDLEVIDHIRYAICVCCPAVLGVVCHSRNEGVSIVPLVLDDVALKARSVRGAPLVEARLCCGNYVEALGVPASVVVRERVNLVVVVVVALTVGEAVAVLALDMNNKEIA